MRAPRRPSTSQHVTWADPRTPNITLGACGTQGKPSNNEPHCHMVCLRLCSHRPNQLPTTHPSSYLPSDPRSYPARRRTGSVGVSGGGTRTPETFCRRTLGADVAPPPPPTPTQPMRIQKMEAHTSYVRGGCWMKLGVSWGWAELSTGSLERGVREGRGRW